MASQYIKNKAIVPLIFWDIPIFSQYFTAGFDCIENPRFHRSQRNLQKLGDLFIAVATVES